MVRSPCGGFRPEELRFFSLSFQLPAVHVRALRPPARRAGWSGANWTRRPCGRSCTTSATRMSSNGWASRTAGDPTPSGRCGSDRARVSIPRPPGPTATAHLRPARPNNGSCLPTTAWCDRTSRDRPGSCPCCNGPATAPIGVILPHRTGAEHSQSAAERLVAGIEDQVRVSPGGRSRHRLRVGG